MSTSGRKNLAQIRQGPSERHSHNEAQAFENQVQFATGVICTIRIKPDQIVIYAKDYTDFVLAKKEIKGRVSVEILQG